MERVELLLEDYEAEPAVLRVGERRYRTSWLDDAGRRVVVRVWARDPQEAQEKVTAHTGGRRTACVWFMLDVFRIA
jgi:hypothetical protein